MRIKEEGASHNNQQTAIKHSNFNSVLIRFLDIVLSLFGIIALFPIFGLIALLIKIDSRGPALFRQQRYGQRKQIFKIYKFRTMTQNASQEKFKQASMNDSRVTKLGRILRSTSIDELPQLINVLAGDMSLVGPRPHPIELDDQFEHTIQNYHYRFFVKPGITGLAQVRGHRGPTTTVEQMCLRINSDIEYVRSISIVNYAVILIKTLVLIVNGKKLRGF